MIACRTSLDAVEDRAAEEALTVVERAREDEEEEVAESKAGLGIRLWLSSCIFGRLF